MTQHDLTSQNQQGRHMKYDGSCLFNGPKSDLSTTYPEQDGPNLTSEKY